MSAASNNLRKSISESDARVLADRVTALERRWPLEVKVVVSTRGGQHALGAIRLLALLVIVAELVTWGLWVAVPAWGFHLLILGLLFFGTDVLGRLPFSRLLTSKRERSRDVENRAQESFLREGVAQTQARNGVLLYFSLPERMFYLLPDAPLAMLFPASEWALAVQGLHKALVEAPADKRIFQSVMFLLDDLEKKAALALPERKSGDVVPAEISDALVFE